MFNILVILVLFILLGKDLNKIYNHNIYILLYFSVIFVWGWVLMGLYFDVVRVIDNFLIHTQVEFRNGKVFMRAKKRSVLFIK